MYVWERRGSPIPGVYYTLLHMWTRMPETEAKGQVEGGKEKEEEEEEGSKLRVSVSQGQRHSSISADRASLEGGPGA